MTGRRSDGYHFLDSLVGFCEFGDRLEISLNEARDEIITEGTFGGEIGDNNIIRKTLEKFRETTKWDQPVRIRKRNSNWSWARWRLFRCSNNAQAFITNSKQPSPYSQRTI